MPTVIDRAMNNRNLLLAFAGIVTVVTVYSIWGTDIFPQQQSSSPLTSSSSSSSTSAKAATKPDPKGEPESWSEEDAKTWLNDRHFTPGHASHQELVAMVRSAMRAPGSGYTAHLKESGPMGDVEGWSEKEMREWLEKKKLAHGHAEKEELIAMVRSAQRAPKV